MPGVTADGPPPSGTGQRLGAPGSAPSSGDASDAPAAGRGETGAAVGRGVSGPRSDANPTAVLCSGNAPPSGRRRCRAVGRGSGPRGRRSFSLLGREDAALPAAPGSPRSPRLREPAAPGAANTRGGRSLPSPRPNRAPFLWAAAAASPGSRTDPDPPNPLPATQRESSIKTMDKFSFHIQKQPRPKENKKKTDPPPQKKKRIVRLNKMCSEHTNQPTPVCAAQHSAQQNRDTGGGNGQHSKKTNENPQRNQCVS